MFSKRTLQRFIHDESGVLLAEALILLPLLIWAFLALFVYWDVFRTMNTSQKAAYSIADLVSRQAVVTPAYITGMQSVFDFLVPGVPRSELRITSVQYNDTKKEYLLLFSKSTGSTMIPYTQTTIQALTTRIPKMSHLDSVVLVETEVDYEPGFDTGLMSVGTGVPAQTFHEFIVTRPRFYRRICMTIPACPPDPT